MDADFIAKQFNKRENSDVIVHLPSKDLYLHSFVLSSLSTVLGEELGTTKVLDFRQHELRFVIEQFFGYFYTKKWNVPNDHLGLLWVACHTYKIDTLRKEVETKISPIYNFPYSIAPYTPRGRSAFSSFHEIAKPILSKDTTDLHNIFQNFLVLNTEYLDNLFFKKFDYAPRTIWMPLLDKIGKNCTVTMILNAMKQFGIDDIIVTKIVFSLKKQEVPLLVAKLNEIDSEKFWQNFVECWERNVTKELVIMAITKFSPTSKVVKDMVKIMDDQQFFLFCSEELQKSKSKDLWLLCKDQGPFTFRRNPFTNILLKAAIEKFGVEDLVVKEIISVSYQLRIFPVEEYLSETFWMNIVIRIGKQCPSSILVKAFQHFHSQNSLITKIMENVQSLNEDDILPLVQEFTKNENPQLQIFLQNRIYGQINSIKPDILAKIPYGLVAYSLLASYQQLNIRVQELEKYALQKCTICKDIFVPSPNVTHSLNILFWCCLCGCSIEKIGNHRIQGGECTNSNAFEYISYYPCCKVLVIDDKDKKKAKVQTKEGSTCHIHTSKDK